VSGAPGLWPRLKSLLGSNFRRTASWCLAHYSITAGGAKFDIPLAWISEVSNQRQRQLHRQQRRRDVSDIYSSRYGSVGGWPAEDHNKSHD
jgi:hypothetical protein